MPIRSTFPLNPKRDELAAQAADNPFQPMYVDESGVRRFRHNQIVVHLLRLLEKFGYTLNDLAIECYDVPATDWEQFAALHGYSVSAWCGLSHTRRYVADIASDIALAHHEGRTPSAPEEIELGILRGQVSRLREALREVVPDLFGVHPEELGAG